MWPAVETPRDLIRAAAPFATMAGPAPAPLAKAVAVPRVAATRRRWRVSREYDGSGVILALFGLARFSEPDDSGQTGAAAAMPLLLQPLPASLAPTPVVTPPSRWFASGWLLARGGAIATDSPLLGGAQAGVRIGYTLDRRRRVAISARASTPLAARGREVAVGLEWQPTRNPVRVFVEERVSLDGAGTAPAAGVYGGFERAAFADFRLEGYGAAGAVSRAGVSGFADGKLRLARPVARAGGVAIDLGGGLWGSAQRGATRLDIGPSLGATVRIADRAVRLSLDWRQRIAGDAAPGSGAVLAIGADF